MPRIKYTEYKPSAEARKLIDTSNQILADYEFQGYQLTLRQLYYQLVARDIIPNNVKSYNRLGDIISRAREGGLVDWLHIVDRTRNVREKPHWVDGHDFLQAVSRLSTWEVPVDENNSEEALPCIREVLLLQKEQASLESQLKELGQ